MTIRVLISRRIPTPSDRDAILLNQLEEMMVQLRNLANQQPGYISGETLRNVDDKREYLVISTWKSEELWKKWFEKDERRSLQIRIDAMLGAPSEYKVFSY